MGVFASLLVSLKTGQCLCKALGFFESLLGSFQGFHCLFKALGVFASRVGSFKASCGLYELCGVFGNYAESLQVFWVLCKALGILKIFWGSLQVSGRSLKVLGFFFFLQFSWDLWKPCRVFGSLHGSLEGFRVLCKLCGFFASLPWSLQSYCSLWKTHGVPHPAWGQARGPACPHCTRGTGSSNSLSAIPNSGFALCYRAGDRPR